MLPLQRLLRSRPKWSCGTAHIFWYMMDEHMYLCLECAYIIFGFWIYDLTENTNYNRKHYKRAVLSIAGLQMISRDTPFSPVLGEKGAGDKEAGQSG